MRYALLAVGMLLAWITPSFASATFTQHDASYRMALSDETPGIRVDWSRQTVFIITQAQASSTKMGRKAYLAALDTALEMARQQVRIGLSGMKMTSYATVKDAVVTQVIAEDYVTEVTKSVRPVVDKWDAGKRTVTLMCALPMLGTGSVGELAARLLKTEQQSFAIHAVPPVTPKEKMTLRPKEPIVQISDGPYTGVILDCRGLYYTPVLLPKLVAENGKEFWGTLTLNHLLVKEKGVAEYQLNLQAALNSPRVGDTPLILRPIGTAGTLRGDLVFNVDDAKLLTEQNDIANFLAKLNVVIIID